VEFDFSGRGSLSSGDGEERGRERSGREVRGASRFTNKPASDGFKSEGQDWQSLFILPFHARTHFYLINIQLTVLYKD
jgi:hypothetical protein